MGRLKTNVEAAFQLLRRDRPDLTDSVDIHLALACPTPVNAPVAVKNAPVFEPGDFYRLPLRSALSAQIPRSPTFEVGVRGIAAWKGWDKGPRVPK
ncbi:hypothetical protein IscW_ISCW001168 [Ixodes scapularis]|uniref:Uncharacterized protein n=1 Tax=Ixodes scapularis TaxID=6945 RepID=B7P2D1_IXOSC|nr:hypothetical protein IscW_ISCW001168 [Ixodes scapularis]|eukprot:XP_002402160.1 hypothetical protein IscW_ISCW001168 [Ixodes scapularis]